MDREAEDAAFATLEMLTSLLPGRVGQLAGQGVRIARLALDQEDPEAYLQALLDGLEKDAQAQARGKFG